MKTNSYVNHFSSSASYSGFRTHFQELLTWPPLRYKYGEEFHYNFPAVIAEAFSNNRASTVAATALGKMSPLLC
jgi:hypothetical protein